VTQSGSTRPWNFRKLQAQSSNVSFATFQWKETFDLELWPLKQHSKMSPQVGLVLQEKETVEVCMSGNEKLWATTAGKCDGQADYCCTALLCRSKVASSFGHLHLPQFPFRGVQKLKNYKGISSVCPQKKALGFLKPENLTGRIARITFHHLPLNTTENSQQQHPKSYGRQPATACLLFWKIAMVCAFVSTIPP